MAGIETMVALWTWVAHINLTGMLQQDIEEVMLCPRVLWRRQNGFAPVQDFVQLGVVLEWG